MIWQSPIEISLSREKMFLVKIGSKSSNFLDKKFHGLVPRRPTLLFNEKYEREKNVVDLRLVFLTDYANM